MGYYQRRENKGYRMAHQHHHHETESMGDRRLAWAIAINMLLTLAQLAGGLISGSLALIADALHNFSDAASLWIAWIARKIGRRSADETMTFGYRRAEVIAALVNLVTLVIIGLYLVYEALWRIYAPQEITGWIVVIVAAIALVIDVMTAILTYTMSKDSLNIKAAFLHNVSDALASVGVILAGTLIILYRWYWVDTLVTLVVAGYVLYQAFVMLPEVVTILMEGDANSTSPAAVIERLEQIEDVANVHHLHLWQIGEHHSAMEAHVVTPSFEHYDALKARIKEVLHDEFSIDHATLEFETRHCGESRCSL